MDQIWIIGCIDDSPLAIVSLSGCTVKHVTFYLWFW